MSGEKSSDWPAVARRVIAARLSGADPALEPASSPDAQTHAGVFVTLRHNGELRGCIGNLDCALSLPIAVQRAALAAAFSDSRFPPLQARELADVRIDVSILAAPTPMVSLDDLELGVHGVIVQRGCHRGLFLPQVALDHALGKQEFLQRCCTEKAGLPPDAWCDPGAQVLLFTTEVYNEGGAGAMRPA